MPSFHTRDGARLHYHDIGRGPACVMLHAFGMRASMWLPFTLPLSSRRRFVMPDFRGFGGSRGVRPCHGDVLRQNADDLHDLLGHLRLDRAKLVGFSIGAGTALAYQERYGFDRFDAYLHLDHTPCIRNKPGWSWGLMGADNAQALERGRALLRAFEGVDCDQKLTALSPVLQREFWSWFGMFFQSCFGQPWWQALARIARGYGPANAFLLNGDDWSIYLDCVRAFIDRDYDFRESLRNVNVPIWVGVGSRSRVFPPQGGRAMAKYARKVRVIEYGYSGHVLLAEAPARVAWTLRRFLALEPRGAAFDPSGREEGFIQ